jgi:hypothetical protein
MQMRLCREVCNAKTEMSGEGEGRGVFTCCILITLTPTRGVERGGGGWGGVGSEGGGV